MTRHWGLGLVLVLSIGGCNGGTGSPDTGTDAFASGYDGSATDAGTSDGGPRDAGDGGATTDGGPTDAGADAFTPPVCACATTAMGPTRGSAIAITPDDNTLVSVNRDVGSVTISRIDWSGTDPALSVVAEVPLATGVEPWQVAIDACGRCAYVVARQSQQVFRIEGIDTATPTVGPHVSVGSEPTALALSPNNTQLYVTNWVEGTVSVVDPVAMSVSSTIDLNAPLAATNRLGPAVTSRPALAHPRAIAITNNGDALDNDEAVLVTEWFATRTAPESATTADTTHAGLVYRIATGTSAVTTIDLPPVTNTGFQDHTGGTTGCYPNQLASITIEGTFAYVTSTCASPQGPLGVFQRGACVTNAQCSSFGGASTCVSGACSNVCVIDADCGAPTRAGACNVVGGGRCAPNLTDVQTTTHPALSIIDLGAGTASTTTLDARFADPTVASARMPLLPTDLGFRQGGFAYITAEGADAVFRLTITAGAITAVGSPSNHFIDLRRPTGDTLIRLPIGIAMASAHTYAFVADDGSRDVTALELSVQAIAGDQVSDFRIEQASALPTVGSPQDSVLRGRRFFTTGLGRWSLRGEAWGACAACHVDGLTDDVTWYFARGPRQSTSLDGTFASLDPTDQRILNWTGIFDEVADFEGNVRGVSGGIGAIVSANSMPPVVADRINVANESPPQQSLMGSSDDTANPSGTGTHPHSVIHDWSDIRNYIASIRSPRAPVGLVAADVTAGHALFADPSQGNCIGCHSGAKWTISRTFYVPGDTLNPVDGAASGLASITWNNPVPGFPAALFPSSTPGSQTMRFGVAATEQLQCSLRPVGTYGVSDPAINVLELRQDMLSAAEGNAATGHGYNVPSLLGLSVGGAYFHGGNARTLEEVFDTRFVGHHQSAIAQVFSPAPAQVRQLVAFLLSIDESTPTIAVPSPGSSGGVLCHYP
jgi:YVTN family beta-propeller protein